MTGRLCKTKHRGAFCARLLDIANIDYPTRQQGEASLAGGSGGSGPGSGRGGTLGAPSKSKGKGQPAGGGKQQESKTSTSSPKKEELQDETPVHASVRVYFSSFGGCRVNRKRE